MSGEGTEASSIPIGSYQRGRCDLPVKSSTGCAHVAPFEGDPCIVDQVIVGQTLWTVSDCTAAIGESVSIGADPEPSLAGHLATIKREFPPQALPPKLGLVDRFTAKASRHRRRNDRREKQRQDDGIVA